MPSFEQSAELLVSSYQYSAQRIMAALNGALPITNSRPGARPPGPSPGVVFGLCGQGGRHPYFQLPRRALEQACNRLLARGSFPPWDAIQAAEELLIACRDLRRVASFDPNTGCVNDTCPSVVPLLPPEEIWCDGRELPNDVWRLISFENDLVSSGLATNLFSDDWPFSSTAPEALCLRYALGRLGSRRVSFSLTSEAIPATYASQLPASRTLTLSAARLFFEIGALLTPLGGQTFARAYPLVRYLHWLETATSDLKVSDAFKADSIDCRYRGLFAEEVGIGMMAAILSDQLLAAPIVNTAEAIATLGATHSGVIADFLAEAPHPTTGQRVTIVCESKGSLGRLVAKGRRKHAKDQVAHTSAQIGAAPIDLRLTFCSTIYYAAQRKSTHCRVADPPEEPEAERGRHTLSRVNCWRFAYSQILQFVGLSIAARQVLRGAPATGIQPWTESDRQSEEPRSHLRYRRQQRTRELYSAFLVLDVGEWGIAIRTDVLAVLQKGVDERTLEALSRSLARAREQDRAPPAESGSTFFGSLGIGCVRYADLDMDRDSVVPQ